MVLVIGLVKAVRRCYSLIRVLKRGGNILTSELLVDRLEYIFELDGSRCHVRIEQSQVSVRPLGEFNCPCEVHAD